MGKRGTTLPLVAMHVIDNITLAAMHVIDKITLAAMHVIDKIAEAATCFLHVCMASLVAPHLVTSLPRMYRAVTVCRAEQESCVLFLKNPACHRPCG